MSLKLPAGCRLYREAPLSQRAVSAVLITCLFALAAWYALRWRTRLGEELKVARDDAVEANRVKDRFIANLNHEIRTPMNAMVAGAQLLDREHMGGEQRALLEAVQHSADHLLQLVNDVLDYERLEAGELRLDAIEFSLREMAGSAVAMFGAQAKAKQLSLSLDLVEGLPDVWIGDPMRLRQVLCNLLSNSIKFTPPHGRVVLRVASAATPEGGTACASRWWTAARESRRMRSRGCSSHMGKATHRSPAASAGPGLGLSICKELLRLMKGSIEVESQPGAGSTFRVTVPLVPASPDGQRSMATEPVIRRTCLPT